MHLEYSLFRCIINSSEAWAYLGKHILYSKPDITKYGRDGYGFVIDRMSNVMG